MNLRIAVSSIMTEDLITISPNDTMKKVEDIFNREHIHHLPVIDEGKLVGIVSKTDYYHFKRGYNHAEVREEVEEKRLISSKVQHVMTTGLAKLEPEDPLDVALEVFKENLFHALPIVRNDHLRGIVTTLDVIKYFADTKVENK